MTRTAETTWTMVCDGTLATACDAAHPGRPHHCPETLTAADPLTLQRASTDARWLTSMVGTTEVHHCPAHRHQAHQAPATHPYDCGHATRRPGCGGCDPGAIETVVLDDGTQRPYDPARDTQPPDPYWDERGKQHQRQDG